MTLKIPHNISLICDTRFIFEMGEYLLSLPELKSKHTGNNDIILVLPGFLTGDFCTSPMRTFLNSIGFNAKGWNLGINMGPTNEVMAGVTDRIKYLNDKYGKQISIVGWSLGGIYAREISKRIPDSIKQVITLGTPFNGLNASNIIEYFEENGINGLDTLTPNAVNQLHVSPPMPYMSIYSKSDELIHWKSCVVNDHSSMSESFEIDSSHFGLCHNPSTIDIVANRLSQDIENWKPYSES